MIFGKKKKILDLEGTVQWLVDAQEADTTVQGFGINVKGVVQMAEDLPESAEKPGDAYLVGLTQPYEMYIWTNTSPDPSWVSLGTFPAPGPRGANGSNGTDGVGISSISVVTQGGTLIYLFNLSNGSHYTVTVPLPNTWKTYATEPMPNEGNLNDFALVDGRYVYQKTKPNEWYLLADLKGAQGAQGLPGEQGPKGDTGPSFRVVNDVPLASYQDLPEPTVQLQKNGWAYTVLMDEEGTVTTDKHIWVISGESSDDLAWIDLGLSGIQGPRGPAGIGISDLTALNTQVSITSVTKSGNEVYIQGTGYAGYGEGDYDYVMGFETDMTIPIAGGDYTSVNVSNNTIVVDVAANKIDSVPTQSSTNFITSGAVYSAIVSALNTPV